VVVTVWVQVYIVGSMFYARLLNERR